MPSLVLNRYLPHGASRRDLFGDFFEVTDTQSNQINQAKRLRGRRRPGLDAPSIVRRLETVRTDTLPVPLAVGTAEDGCLVVVIPTVSGRRFSEIIQEFRAGRAWGRHNLLRLIAATCDALAALHRAGLHHGGINADAIFVDVASAGSITLLPFSIFSALRSHEYLDGSADEVAYVSQEQLRGDGSNEADIYSVGMLLYRCFGREPPFVQETAWEIAEEIVLGDHRPFEVLAAPNDDACGDIIASDLAQLREIVNKALQRDPGTRYSSMPAMQAAIRLLAERFDPYNIAVRLFLNENYDAAILLLEQTIREKQHIDSANLLLGRVYGLVRGDYDRGIIHFKRAQLANPRSFRPHEYQAQLHERRGSHSLAVAEYEKAILSAERERAYHEQERLRLALASVLSVRNEPGDVLRALSELELVLTRNPWRLSASASRARIYRSMGRVSDAIAECLTARDKIAQMPSIEPRQQGEIFDLLGALFYQEGQLDRAIGFYERAIAADARRTDTHNTLAGIYQAQGDSDKALQHWFRSLSFKPDQMSVLAAVAQLLPGKRR